MRLRRREALHPEIERQLRGLDAALAGEPVEAELAELRDLVLAVQAERPVPSEEFTHALDARAAAGFHRPRHDRAASVRRPPAPRRRLAPLALGTGAAVFIVATAIFSGVLSGGDGDQRRPADRASGSTSSPGPVPAAAARTAAGSAEKQGSAPASPLPAPSPSGVAPRVRDRKVERAASLTLSAPPAEIEDVADGVIRTADRYGGFVFDSSVSSGEQGAGATIDLRIPSSRLEAAIADLSKLSHVRARSQRSLDITARFTSPRRRLADANAERRALLKQLARAVTPNETASVRARLRLATRRIEGARASLRRLENRVGYAAVSVAVEPGAARADGGPWTPGDALDDALSVLQAIAGALLIALAVLVPASLIGLLALVARRAYLRRAREASLDSVEKPSLR